MRSCPMDTRANLGTHLSGLILILVLYIISLGVARSVEAAPSPAGQHEALDSLALPDSTDTEWTESNATTQDSLEAISWYDLQVALNPALLNRSSGKVTADGPEAPISTL